MLKNKNTLKRSPLRKKSKSNTKKLQDELWELCKQITRLRYGNRCYTCHRTGLVGSNWHTGHMWAKASLPALLKYDLRILRPQCYFCNVNCGGRGAEFYARMCEEQGKEYMDSLSMERNNLIKADEIFYKNKISEYKNILLNL